MVALIVFLSVAVTTFSFAQAAPVALVLLAALAVREMGLSTSFSRLRALSAPIFASLALAFVALASGLWAPSLPRATMKGVGLAGVVVATCFALGLLSARENARQRAIANGLLIGLSLALLMVAVNAVTADWLTRRLFTLAPWLAAGIVKNVMVTDGVVVHVAESVGNRPMALATLLLVPGLIVAWKIGGTVTARLFLLSALVFIAAVVVKANHQSSQLAVIIAAVVALVAWLNTRITRRVLLVVWCIGILAAPLIGALGMKMGAHRASWLFESASARVIIWGSTAERIGDRPILGHGAAAAQVLQKTQARPAVREGEVFARYTARHAHNAYLQIWFDLGLVGAVLLAAFGASLIARTGLLPEQDQWLALTAFAAGAAMMATSYGLWQLWIQASLGLSIAISIAALRLPADAGAAQTRGDARL